MTPSHTSPWLETTPDIQRFPVFSGSASCDVVVVGGGMVGILTAWELARAGSSVVLLEKTHLAASETGYTTAFLTRVPDVNAADLVQRYGVAYLQQVFRATTAAQQRLHNIITEEHITCGYRECSSYHVAETQHLSALTREWEALRQADDRMAWVEGTAVPLPGGYAAAITTEGEGRFDVRQFLFGLLATPTGKRIRIFEASGVTAISGASPVIVRTDLGEVQAKKVCVASGIPPAFVAGVPPLASVVTYALLAKYDGAVPIPDNIFWDSAQPYQYFRQLDEHTIMIGGADHAVGHKPRRDPHEELSSALQRFGGTPTITHTWSGGLVRSADGLPMLGTDAQNPHVVYATGLLGNGMVMGMMAAGMLADATRGVHNEGAQLFSPQRFPSSPPPRMNTAPQRSSSLVLAWAVPLVLLAALTFVVNVFWNERGGLSFLEGADAKTASLLLFPLAGLVAFTLLWFQFMLGSNMHWLRPRLSWITRFHRTEGVFVLLFALVHPFMIAFAYGTSAYLAKEFVSPELTLYVWIGQIQLLLLLCTAGTAIFAKTLKLTRWWHAIHYLNYLIFVLVWVHSWYLGTDVQGTSLRYVWFLFAITAIASVIGRFLPRRRTVVTTTPAVADGYVRVAAVRDIQTKKPFLATLEGRQIAIVRIDESYYAIDNACSHAGGSLCDGSLEGSVIQCPLHGSKFDVRTGAVVAPPARLPQKTYRVRVSGENIEVAPA